MILSMEIDEMRNAIGKFSVRLTEMENELHGANQINGASEEELIRLIRMKLAETGMTQRQIAVSIGCTPSSVSLILRQKRKAPMWFVIETLELLGYKLVVLPEALPFTPNEGD